MGPRAGLDGCRKSPPPTGIRSPDGPACNQSLYRLSYPAHTTGAERVESMWEESGAYRNSVADLTERDHLEDRELDGSII